ncbi:MAG: ribosomal-processing cysteine protease Prp [Clostridiales bacterium]|nr:ribosomal-processing cysteine protease Prp [Clostridiales bacterium]
MTKVKVTKQDNSIVKIECDGHTGYGVEGEDIVCSALSSIVQTAVLGLFGVAGANVDFTTDAKRGYLRAVLPQNLDSATRHDCDVILNTMLLGIADLHEGFSDFIELEVK